MIPAYSEDAEVLRMYRLSLPFPMPFTWQWANVTRANTRNVPSRFFDANHSQNHDIIDKAGCRFLPPCVKGSGAFSSVWLRTLPHTKRLRRKDKDKKVAVPLFAVFSLELV
jgi:hypothetical protein